MLKIYLLLILITLNLPLFAQETDGETINVESSIVVLNTTITDKEGKAVSGLKKSQFKIFEDGKEQTLDFFGAESTPFAAVILIDTSGSMESRISLARSAAITFLDGLRPEDNAAIYNFDSKVSLVQDFSNSRDVLDKVFELKANGMTVLNDAIMEAAQVLSKREEKRKAIIVLSDGADTKSKYGDSKVLKAAITAGATIYTIDMSSIEMNGRDRLQSQMALKNFAGKSGGKFIAVSGGIALRQAFAEIVGELGSQYTLTYSPTNNVKDGKWRAIEVRVSRPNLIIRTRKGYNAPKK
ncbi:MAG TPA: VWA domain-containing protein [Pyrinomonadaceae bacterium]|nr:VWA domain-containing protein [Pyrinomonadaceae bacterium]